MTTRFDHLLFIYWCPRCRRLYCRELEDPQSCGCGAMAAEHLAPIGSAGYTKLENVIAFDSTWHGASCSNGNLRPR